MTRNDRGQALVEFALVLPLILLASLGLTDATRAVWQYNELALAAREGTRYAIVHGAGSLAPAGPAANDAAVQAEVLRFTVGMPSVTVASAWTSGTNNRGDKVSVDVTAPFVPMLSRYLLNGAFNVTLRGGSELVIQR
jgi:Flp pilus assembly protein TadG